VVGKEPEHPCCTFYYWPCRCWYLFLLFIALLVLVAARGLYHISLFGAQIAIPVFPGPRKVALGKTIFLAFVWMYVTTILPIIFQQGMEYQLCFIYGQPVFSRYMLICILFDYRDREDDKANGIRSLITTWMKKGSFTCSLFPSLYSVSALCYYIAMITDITITHHIADPGNTDRCFIPYAKRIFLICFITFSWTG
jgi:hypothetical protein